MVVSAEQGKYIRVDWDELDYKKTITFEKSRFASQIENVLYLMSQDSDAQDNVQLNLAATPRCMFKIEDLKKQSIRNRIVSLMETIFEDSQSIAKLY